MQRLSIALLWWLASSLAWFCMLGTEVWLRPSGLPAPRYTSAYLAELCLGFSLVASIPLLVTHLLREHFVRIGARAGLWSGVVVVALSAWPAYDQAAFLTTGDSIAGSEFYLPVRAALLVGLLLALLALWAWHLRGLTQPRVGRLLARFPRWSRYCVWALAGVTALAVLGNSLQFHLSAYAHLARALLWPTWLLIGTLTFRFLRDLRTPGWLAAVLLIGIGGHIASARLDGPTAVSRARHEVLRRGKTTSLVELMMTAPGDSAATIDLSHPARFDCAQPPAPLVTHALPTPEGKRNNIILISIDALRSDAIRWTYDGKPLMPNLRKFQDGAVDYSWAVTPYPATLMALGGAVTGQGPSDILFSPQPADNIFQLTEDHFDKSFVVFPTSPWFRLPVVDQLLLQNAAAIRRGGAASQTSAFISSLRKARKAKRSVLAWVHYFEPHSPYDPHPGHDKGKSRRGLYRGELSYLDRQLGRLFRFLESKKYYDDSLVLLFSDHGEALGELQYYGHHVYLNRWIADVPLMMRAPGLPAGKRIEPADLTDIAPTVLDFAGVPYRQDAMVGLSLFAPTAARQARLNFAEAFPIRGRDLFVEATRSIDDVNTLAQRVDAVQRGARNYLPKVSVVSTGHRLIVNRVTGVEELYDRTRDKHELNNLAHDDLPVLGRLRSALKRWTDTQAQRLYCAVVNARPDATDDELDDGESPDAGALAPSPTQRILPGPTGGKAK